MTPKYTRLALTSVLAIPLMSLGSALATTLHVDPSNPSSFAKIQEAIDAAYDFDTIVVHPGVYREHVNYHGVMVTVQSTDPNDGAVVQSTIIDGSGTGNVVTFRNSEGPYSILRGLTIRSGQNGIECTGADTSPVISQCRIISNNGAGVVCSLASPTIADSTIENNKTAGISGNHHGEIASCRICANGGGAVGHAGLANCRGSVLGCVLSSNDGDGLYEHIGEVRNCVVSGNLRNGLYFTKSSGCNIVNCTIVGNKNDGISFEPSATASSRYAVTNNIIVLNGNFAAARYWYNIFHWEVSVNYCDVWGNRGGDYGGGAPDSVVLLKLGTANISADPLFVKRGYWDDGGTWHEGDYHLKSKLGRWDPRSGTWGTDPADSPCLDRGDPATAFLDEPYPNGGRINLGAYGGTVEASKSVGGMTCLKYPEMDFNHDCKVDQADLDLFMKHWLECGLDPSTACWPQGPPAPPHL